jgi:hypothetical protein
MARASIRRSVTVVLVFAELLVFRTLDRRLFAWHRPAAATPQAGLLEVPRPEAVGAEVEVHVGPTGLHE